MARQLKYFEAIREAQAACLASDDAVYVIGNNVPSPSGVFGTTTGLQERFGAARVRDMPSSENGMTGVVLGSALVGMRPVLIHMRVDFAVLSMDLLVNQAAKWHYMYGGRMTAPITVRVIVGRGWGQGPQHSQSLQAWFAHVPGLKVVMPTTPHDAKGMLIAAIQDDAPVIVLEHRWLYNIDGPVPEGHYCEPLDCSKIVRTGRHITLAGLSYMTLECLSAAAMLAQIGVEAEVIDLRCLTPIDGDTLVRSVAKTGHLIVADTAQTAFGAGAEVVAIASGRAFSPPQITAGAAWVAAHPLPHIAGVGRSVLSARDGHCPAGAGPARHRTGVAAGAANRPPMARHTRPGLHRPLLTAWRDRIIIK